MHTENIRARSYNSHHTEMQSLEKECDSGLAYRYEMIRIQRIVCKIEVNAIMVNYM